MKKKQDKIVLLYKYCDKNKLNSVEILISKALIFSCISHKEFVLVNDVQKDHDDMKEKRKNPNDK